MSTRRLHKFVCGSDTPVAIIFEYNNALEIFASTRFSLTRMDYDIAFYCTCNNNLSLHNIAKNKFRITPRWSFRRQLFKFSYRENNRGYIIARRVLGNFYWRTEVLRRSPSLAAVAILAN